MDRSMFWIHNVHLKKEMEVSTGLRIPVIDNGIKTGTRERLKQILYA